MERCDYYFFQTFTSHAPARDVKSDTLAKAKKEFLRYRRYGARMTQCIIGCSSKEGSPFVTYTPFYGDTQDFGRTVRTCAGIRFEKELRATKNGNN